MEAVDVNLWAVLAAAVVYFAIGAIWYSPVLFAAPWMTAVGKSAEDLKKSGSSLVFVASFLLLLLLSYVLAHILAYAGADTVSGGLVTGVWLWLGFVATTVAINAMYAGRPQMLTMIDGGYHLVGMVAASLTLVLIA